MDPCELSVSITATAITIASKLSNDELDLASAIFTQLGDTLATISAQRSLCSTENTFHATEESKSI